MIKDQQLESSKIWRNVIAFVNCEILFSFFLYILTVGQTNIYCTVVRDGLVQLFYVQHEHLGSGIGSNGLQLGF